MLNSPETVPTAPALIQGDVGQVLASWPDECADLVLADPGYGLKKGDWDLRPDYGDWVSEVMRVLRPTGTGYIFGETETIASHWAAFPDPKRILTWAVSNRVSPKVRTWQPTSESIVMLWKGQPWFDIDAVREPYNSDYERHKGKPRAATLGRFGSRATAYPASSGALPRDVVRGPGLSGKVGAREGLGHIAQKPLWLMERLIRASCPPGGILLDLYSGTGTGAVAAHRLGRRWIAVEKDPRWCQVALDRLRREGAVISGITRPSRPVPSEIREFVAGLQKELDNLKEEVARLRGAQGSI